MTRYILEGRWSGYSASQSRTVHREVVDEARAEKLKPLQRIVFTDGTNLTLSLDPMHRGEKAWGIINAYGSLIREAERKQVGGVYYVKAEDD